MPKAKGRVRIVVSVDEVSLERGLFRVEMGGAKRSRRYALTPTAAYRLYQLLHDEITRTAEIRALRKEGA